MLSGTTQPAAARANAVVGACSLFDVCLKRLVRPHPESCHKYNRRKNSVFRCVQHARGFLWVSQLVCPDEVDEAIGCTRALETRCPSRAGVRSLSRWHVSILTRHKVQE